LALPGGPILAALIVVILPSSAQSQVYQSVMTRPVGSDGFTPSPGERPPTNTLADTSSGTQTLDLTVPVTAGSSQQPGLLGDGTATNAQPSNPELLQNPLPGNGPITANPGDPPANGAPLGLGLAEPFPPPGPLSSDQGPDASQPARQRPMLDGFRRLFGPEPNGNWCNEPVHFDTFLGFIDDRTAQNTGVLGGFRLGWDYDTYWGVETRLAFTSLQEDTGPVVVWDESLLYYPWGDSRVRPYLTLGLGVNEVKIVDPSDDSHSRLNLVDMPFGFGFKYRIHEWLVLRFDVLDNLAFGSGDAKTMNNLSFTTGFEYRFGGGHSSYWPWDPAPAR
jgi:hypothetical protein